MIIVLGDLKIIVICSGTSVFLSCKWIFNYVFTESLIFSWKLEQLHNWEKSTIFLFLDQTEPSEKQSQIAPSAAVVHRTFRSRLTVHTQKIIKGWCPYKSRMPSLVVPCEKVGQAGMIQDHLLESLRSGVCCLSLWGSTQTLVCTLLRLPRGSWTPAGVHCPGMNILEVLSFSLGLDEEYKLTWFLL